MTTKTAPSATPDYAALTRELEALQADVKAGRVTASQARDRFADISRRAGMPLSPSYLLFGR